MSIAPPHHTTQGFCAPCSPQRASDRVGALDPLLIPYISCLPRPSPSSLVHEIPASPATNRFIDQCSPVRLFAFVKHLIGTENRTCTNKAEKLWIGRGGGGGGGEEEKRDRLTEAELQLDRRLATPTAMKRSSRAAARRRRRRTRIRWPQYLRQLPHHLWMGIRSEIGQGGEV